MTALDIRQLADYAAGAGFSGDALVKIVAIALRESGGNPGAIGDIDNPHAGCKSYGLVQINVCPQGTPGGNNRGTPWRENPSTLLDPATNFRAAYEMSGGGRNFGPWTTYRTGIAPADEPKVRAALAGYTPVPRTGATSAAAPIDPGSSSAPAVTPPGPDLTAGSTWIRVFQVIGGFGVILVGVALLARDLWAPPVRKAATQAHRSATATLTAGAKGLVPDVTDDDETEMDDHAAAAAASML